MEGEKETICRLCLRCGGDIFTPLDTFYKENLKVVLPELNLDAATHFVICSKCKRSLAESYDLKMICSRTECIVQTQIEKKNIRDKVPLNHIVNISSAAHFESPNTENFCRVCLKDKRVNYMTIKTADDLFTTALKSCIPELDVELTIDPVMCEICHTMLRYMYSFKNECLSVEEKLRRYSEATSENEIDLTKVLTFLKLETEKSVGEDFLSEFEVHVKEDMDIFDGFPSSSEESSASEVNVKETAGIYKIPDELMQVSSACNDNVAAKNLSQPDADKKGKKEKLLRCYNCRKYGHTSKECLQTFTKLASGIVEEIKTPKNYIPRRGKKCPPGQAPRGTCVYCGKLGHANKSCPNMSFSGMLRPPQPRSQNGGASDAGLQNPDNENNFTEEMLQERIRANKALLGCPRCFGFGHEQKDCGSLKQKRRLLEKMEQQRKSKEQHANQEYSTKGNADFVSNPNPQSQSRGASGFRPQYHHNEGDFSREKGGYWVPIGKTEHINQGYSTERYTNFVSSPNPQSQNRGAPGIRPQYHHNETYSSREMRDYGEYTGRVDHANQEYPTERYTDFVSSSNPQSQSRGASGFRSQYNEGYYNRETRGYGQYSDRAFRN